LLDELLSDPLLPAAAGGVVALLAGLGLYRVRQRRKAAQLLNSAFLESKLQPDSFFGSSGGQRIDTNDGGSTGSSMVYSPGHLDSADDVDPVAEADVYLAYGRDLQAEEILKEALTNHPKRVAIHQKLLEIYAKRRDLASFQSMADQAYRLTQGEGPEWERISELGSSLDPNNSLYRPGGGPGTAPVAQEPVAVPPPPPPAAEPAPAVDLDLDLDFSTEDAAEEPAAVSAPELPLDTAPEMPEEPPMAFDLDLPASPEFSQEPSLSDNSLDFDLPSLPTEEDSAAPAPEVNAPADNSGMLEFDLGALSLDLGSDSAEQPVLAEAPPVAEDDPLTTKLALAEEFNAIGDTDGARSLIQEIIAEASGSMKSRAEEALSKLN